MIKQTDTYVLSFESDPQQKDTYELWKNISAYAKQKKNLEPGVPFAFFLKDSKNNMMAGCNGYIFYDCLHIDQLWVHESLRGLGYGKELIKKSEELGIKNQCKFATVNTMDWEALDFYKKLGYQLEFERGGYANHSTFYFLKKDFI